MTHKNNRRHALKSILASSIAASLSTPSRAGDSPSEKLNLAFIGVGGRGEANLKELQSQNIIALVDVDEKRGGKSFESYPQVQRFKDYRKM
ncbi:MAG: gfo/Idh/MocA family oxidoreductase, partial [Pirellulales bacterium]